MMAHKKLQKPARHIRGRPSLAEKRRIIVGVDFGTTFTGVSIVYSTKKSADDVEVIRRWPGPSKHADEVWKTPSIIAYREDNLEHIITSNRDGKHEITGNHVTPGMKSYTWMKMRMDDNAKAGIFDRDDILDMKSVQGAGLGSLPAGKDATQVCADYLAAIYAHTMQHLENRYSEFALRRNPIEFWLTVPATWSDAAKSATRDAAERAGFMNREHDVINMITEPEAAAIAALSDVVGEGVKHRVSIGDVIVVTDCGGGTVDLTTYEVLSSHPLDFKEVVIGVGGKCGSTTIDRSFHQWMKQVFDDDFTNLPFERIGPGSKFMKEFESCKRDCGADDESSDDYEVTLFMSGVRSSKYYDSRKSTVKIPKIQMENFFQPTISKIKDLLAQQIEDTKAKLSGKGINTIVLVGGFSESQFLMRNLKEWCKKKHGSINLFSPKNAQAAIVKGAALRGLGNIKPSQRQCRRHYGFATAQEFDDELDDEQFLWIDEYNGKRMCRDRMHWVVLKGEAIKDNDFATYEITENYLMGDPRTSEIELFACDSEDPPEMAGHRDVYSVGHIDIGFQGLNLSKFRKGKKKVNDKNLYVIEYDVRVMLSAEQGLLLFEVAYKDKEIGTASIDYTDDVETEDVDGEMNE
ncbi:hypothetical protein FKW77_003710 [Venturia effusa]|uniref:Actin-like ATPase domain-containing protein n=1 Tax=Venturia effusa TaxID=50376 RepID=A0A517LJZ7_9PEZI|nr:hypothetical protein FKW77_003710 [Venturia effusa]